LSHDGYARLADLLLAGMERAGFAALRRKLWEGLDAPRESGRLLELGVGSGRNRPHHPAGWTVVGVDRSSTILRRARSRGLELVVAAEADRLPFRAACFEAVVETFVWCEVDDPVRSVAEAVEALADGGRMVMLDHVRPSGGAGTLADLLTRITGPLVGEHWNRDTRTYVEPAPLRTLVEETLSGGWMRMLVLERESRSRVSPEGATTT
jgi:SAM-dependent methyltransferase